MQLELDVVRAMEEGRLDDHLDDAEKKHGKASLIFLTPLSREMLVDTSVPDTVTQGFHCPSPRQLEHLIAKLLARNEPATVVLRTPGGKAYQGWTPPSTRELSAFNCTSFQIINSQPVRSCKVGNAFPVALSSTPKLPDCKFS